MSKPKHCVKHDHWYRGEGCILCTEEHDQLHPREPTPEEQMEARIAELEAMNDRCMSELITTQALCLNHEGHIAGLEARLALAEKVVEEALTEPCRSEELLEALAAWREGTKS